MIIIALLLVFFMLLTLGILWWNNEGIATFGGLLLLVFILILVMSYNGNINNIARLEAFKNYNVENFSSVVSETEAILSNEVFINSAIVEGSIEKIQVGVELSERMLEWMKAVNDYNDLLAILKAQEKNVFLGGGLVIPPIPNDLIFLTIK